MIAVACIIWSLLSASLKSKSRLELENAALRHQVVVLQRTVPGRIDFSNRDRLFFILLYRWCPSVLCGIDRQAYLSQVLERIADQPNNQIEPLIPWSVEIG
jgi:hypothetical protein